MWILRKEGPLRFLLFKLRGASPEAGQAWELPLDQHRLPSVMLGEGEHTGFEFPALFQA